MMEMVLGTGFSELSEQDVLDVTAGGALKNFLLATGGTVCIGLGLVVTATGNIPGGMIVVGTGCGIIGSM